MKKEILIISPKDIMGKAIDKSLGLFFDSRIFIYGDTLKDPFNGKLLKLLRDDKNRVLVLVGYGNDSGLMLWQYVRNKKGVFNPVVIVGLEHQDSFILRQLEFSAGPAQYHRYLQYPFFLSKAISVITEIRPLYDDWHRRELYKLFGEQDLKRRLPGIMHDLKGVDQQRELHLARYIYTLCQNYKEPDVVDILARIVSELEKGITTNVKVYQKSIKQLLFFDKK